MQLPQEAAWEGRSPHGHKLPKLISTVGPGISWGNHKPRFCPLWNHYSLGIAVTLGHAPQLPQKSDMSNLIRIAIMKQAAPFFLKISTLVMPSPYLRLHPEAFPLGAPEAWWTFSRIIWSNSTAKHISLNQDLLQAAGLLSSTSMVQPHRNTDLTLPNCGSTSHEIQLLQGFLTAIGRRDFFKHSSPYSLIRHFQQATYLTELCVAFWTTYTHSQKEPQLELARCS